MCWTTNCIFVSTLNEHAHRRWRTSIHPTRVIDTTHQHVLDELRVVRHNTCSEVVLEPIDVSCKAARKQATHITQHE